MKFAGRLCFDSDHCLVDQNGNFEASHLPATRHCLYPHTVSDVWPMVESLYLSGIRLNLRKITEAKHFS